MRLRLALRLLVVALTAALVSTGCSNSTASDPIAHACALVAYWADTTGSVSDPDSTPTSVSEVNEIAKQGWPNDTGTAAQFVQLYDDLSSDMSDSQYEAEASAFESANCS